MFVFCNPCVRAESHQQEHAPKLCFATLINFHWPQIVQNPVKVKLELIEEHSSAKIYNTKPELRNRNVNADYFCSSLEIFESVASRTEFVYNFTDKQACECKCLPISVLPAQNTR